MEKTMLDSILENIKHTRRELPHGGQVVVLNDGAVINAEAKAMLQALHSRSTDGIDGHLRILAEKGADNFMSTFYVGYGHKSIGDCGTTIIFIEGVSMLAAKAIQDWALYSGQESSTRYIDFSNQRFEDPAGTDISSESLERLRAFYLESVKKMQEELKRRHPRKEDEKESVYEKAINARAFDIMRGFLPAGATTNLAWSSNLRQVADKLNLLRHHPLAEIRRIAEAIESAVLEAHPNSFSAKRYPATEEYNKKWMQTLYYFHDQSVPDFSATDRVDHELLAEYREILASRPAMTELPKQVDECGDVQFRFKLDFGSFRDIQRHRSVIQRMPLLTTSLGFGEWYINELTPELQEKAKALLEDHEETIKSLNLLDAEAQYYIPMGYNLSNRVTGGISSLVYIAELRATRFVHPTLRVRAKQMADELVKMFGDDGLVIHLDQEPDVFDVKRGEQDIVQK